MVDAQGGIGVAVGDPSSFSTPLYAPRRSEPPQSMGGITVVGCSKP